MPRRSEHDGARNILPALFAQKLSLENKNPSDVIYLTCDVIKRPGTLKSGTIGLILSWAAHSFLSQSSSYIRGHSTRYNVSVIDPILYELEKLLTSEAPYSAMTIGRGKRTHY